MPWIKLKNRTLVKYKNGLNVTVDAGKKVNVEEEFLQSLPKNDYERAKSKEVVKDIGKGNKETKDMVAKEKK